MSQLQCVIGVYSCSENLQLLSEIMIDEIVSYLWPRRLYLSSDKLKRVTVPGGFYLDRGIITPLSERFNHYPYSYDEEDPIAETVECYDPTEKVHTTKLITNLIVKDLYFASGDKVPLSCHTERVRLNRMINMEHSNTITVTDCVKISDYYYFMCHWKEMYNNSHMYADKIRRYVFKLDGNVGKEIFHSDKIYQISATPAGLLVHWKIEQIMELRDDNEILGELSIGNYVINIKNVSRNISFNSHYFVDDNNYLIFETGPRKTLIIIKNWWNEYREIVHSYNIRNSKLVGVSNGRILLADYSIYRIFVL